MTYAIIPLSDFHKRAQVIAPLIQPRLRNLNDAPKLAGFFFAGLIVLPDAVFDGLTEGEMAEIVKLVEDAA